MTEEILTIPQPAAQDMGPLYGALAKAQGQFPEIPKNRQGHGYKYADLAVILRTVRPILAKHSLAIIQYVQGDVLVTDLLHESGAKLSVSYPFVTDATGRMNAIQKVGAANTYARRYALSALLGLAADEDTDAADEPVREEAPRLSPRQESWLDAVLDKLPEGASDRDKAAAIAEQIIADFTGYKTARGLNDGWNSREKLIAALETKHPDLFQSVADCFQSRMAGFTEAAE